MYKLFSAEHSIFSAKVRAYLRFKHDQGDLGEGFEDILATPDLMTNLLTVRSGSPSLPQMEAPDGAWVQDTSEIIDYVEANHSKISIIPDYRTRPKQRLASYIMELLADEWLIVPACWERWHYSLGTTEPNHRAFNEQQWGSFLAPGENGRARRAAGAAFFENIFGISDTVDNPKGPYQGLIHLGCTEATLPSWSAMQQRLLEALESHLEAHDYVLGGRPSLADYALLGPIYVHFYRDPVAGFEICNALAYRDDITSTFIARRERQRLLVETIAEIDVDEIQTDRPVAKLYLPRTGIADLDILELHDFRAASLVDTNALAHRRLSCGVDFASVAATILRWRSACNA